MGISHSEFEFLEYYQDPQLTRDIVAGMLQSGNVLTGRPAELPQELSEIILSAPGIRVERIISQAHASPQGFWYDQDWDEWVVVLQGAARLQFEGEAVLKMTAGSFVNIPAHKRHRVEWTAEDQQTIWLAVHYHAEPSASAGETR